VTTTANRLLLRLVYGTYAWALLFVVIVPVACVLLALPGIDRRRRLARNAAAAVLRLIGSPVAVSGTISRDGGLPVVVANHASYLDGIILTAVLPPEYTFLIKREMNGVPLAGFVLRRLGSEFVDRESPSRRHLSARRLVAAARSGEPLAVFPEGTFDAEPGLKPFHMGAFRAAFRAGRKVQPVVIKGARAKFPAGKLLPKPGPISVEICPPLAAMEFDSDEALMLGVRRALLERLGEADLAPHIPV
jgi:1-acyl-sn-glycerol-3-phosphate acyltransferase